MIVLVNGWLFKLRPIVLNRGERQRKHTFDRPSTAGARSCSRTLTANSSKMGCGVSALPVTPAKGIHQRLDASPIATASKSETTAGAGMSAENSVGLNGSSKGELTTSGSKEAAVHPMNVSAEGTDGLGLPLKYSKSTTAALKRNNGGPSSELHELADIRYSTGSSKHETCDASALERTNPGQPLAAVKPAGDSLAAGPSQPLRQSQAGTSPAITSNDTAPNRPGAAAHTDFWGA